MRATFAMSYQGADPAERVMFRRLGLVPGPDITAAAAAKLIERMLAVTPLGQTFSGGLAAWTGEEAPERLVARADAALYGAKSAGRACVMVHTGQSVTAPVADPLGATTG
ncbi:hypothetical protein GCM10009558_095420 [Virgisporangium aurantiacum]